MTKNSNSLFMYPKERHIRRLSPPKYSRYRSYKISLQEEFYCRCVYCTLPDVLKGHEAFGVDHYRPRSKFPGLEVEYTNLFYSCNICNSMKRDFWPSKEQLVKKHFIPNPCDHVMHGHLKIVGAEIIAKDITGKFTIDVLDLNEAKSVEYRKTLIAIYNSIITEVKEVERKKKIFLSKIKKCTDDATKNDLSKKTELIDKNLAKLHQLQARMIGPM